MAFLEDWQNGETEFVLHTSGSTGGPKRITVTRAQLVASARATGEALGLQAGMRALICLNTAYIAGVMMLVRGLELGLEMTVIGPSRRPFASFVGTDQRFEFTALVPMQLEATLESAAETAILDRCHAVLIGGAPLNPSLMARAQRVAAPLYHTFGMTETVSHIALRRINGAEKSDWFVPLPRVELWRDDRECLVIRGPMTRGETVVTNDRVILREDGCFRWVGRIDHVINSGGVKVQAEQVEAQLQRFFPDRQIAVMGWPDELLGECVLLIIEGEAVDGEILAEGLASIDRYSRPKKVIYCPHFPQTETGKVNRAQLRQELKGKAES